MKRTARPALVLAAIAGLTGLSACGQSTGDSARSGLSATGAAATGTSAAAATSTSAAALTKTAVSATTAASGAAGNLAGCTFTADKSQNGGRNPGLPTTVQTTGQDLTTITFPAGQLMFSMDTAKVPCTAASFKHLADVKYFDGTKCHRLTTSGIFVLQCGDPLGTGLGGPGYTIPDENLTGATYPKGTIAMANTGAAHSGGSQFFICYQDTALPAKYTPFGIVTAGEDVVDAIAAAGTSDGSADGKPKADATMKTFTVV